MGEAVVPGGFGGKGAGGGGGAGGRGAGRRGRRHEGGGRGEVGRWASLNVEGVGGGGTRAGVCFWGLLMARG